MSSKIENKYRQMFESLDCTDSNYIDNFINLISNLLIERDSLLIILLMMVKELNFIVY